MLFYKSWLETRWRFVIGLALLMLSAGGLVVSYPTVAKLVPTVPSLDLSGEIGQRLKEAADIQSTYRGYIWSQWFNQNMSSLGMLFAVLLASGNPLTQGSRGAAQFTLSMPASRSRMLAVRAATGLGQLAAFAFLPSLFIVVMSPGIGERYGVTNIIVHGVCWLAGVAVFYSLTLLFSTIFDDIWRPILLGCGAAVISGLLGLVWTDFATYGIHAVMSGERYFRAGSLPWPGLAISVAAAALLFYGATVYLERRDF